MTRVNTSDRLADTARRADDLLLLSKVVSRFIDVTRATLRNGRSETDGEHTLHLQFLAVAYAAQYHPELNIGKVSLYALVHDFVEVYAGDVNSLNASPEILSKKADMEAAALERLERELGEAWPGLLGFVHAYETLAEPEARYVKCFDKCDPSFTHYDNGGKALHDMGVTDRETFETLGEDVYRRMEPYASEFPDVIALRQELLGRVADTAYSTVY